MGGQCTLIFLVFLFYTKYERFSFCIDANSYVLPACNPTGVLRIPVTSGCLACIQLFTVNHKKRATLFLIIAMAFWVDFYSFCTSGNRKKYSIDELINYEFGVYVCFIDQVSSMKMNRVMRKL